MWLRPIILFFFAGAAAVVLPLAMIGRLRHPLARLLQAGPLEKVGPKLVEPVAGMRSLFTLSIIIRAVPFGAAYLSILLVAFFIMGHAVGAAELTFEQAATIYLFSLALVLVGPLSTHLGIIEGGGIAAGQAWGYGPSEALAMMLGFRLVWTASTWVICGLALLALRGELSRSPGQ